LAKIGKPLVALDHIVCRSCGNKRQFEDFRLFATAPVKMYMDFCINCEHDTGTVVLYRRFSAYGTPEIVQAVFKAAATPEQHRTPAQVKLLIDTKVKVAPANKEELIARELQRREMAKRRLVYFTTTFIPNYRPGWVHQDICRRLERFMHQVEAGMSPRLMIAMPPRAGKSALASDSLPSWMLGHHPDWSIIATSYAQSLPIGFSRAIRDRLKDPAYQAIFPGTKIRPDAQGVELWKTTAGGGYMAAGVGVGITGFGGNVLIADDLIKDQAEASSEVVRESTYQWYQSVLRTRLAPGGGILLIGTRWHWHDPAGRLLEEDEMLAKAGVPLYERENWEVVSYPAIAEHDEYLMLDGRIEHDLPEPEKPKALRLLRKKGDALHPERYPLPELLKIKNTFPSSIWSALYQQAPTPSEGDFFRRDDFRYRWLDPAYRPLCRRFITVDYAIGKKERNDYTVMGAFALDSEDNLYVLEIRRGRWGTEEIVSNVTALVERHQPEIYAGEQGVIHEAVWPEIKRALDAKRLYVSIDKSLVPISDKPTRARPLQGRVQRHKLFFSFDEVTKPDVYDAAEKEMLQFPDGVNDDIVDMLAWGARLALNTSLPTSKAPPKPASWKDRLDSMARGHGISYMGT
jgi:phage terminase large subunit-like protein